MGTGNNYLVIMDDSLQHCIIDEICQRFARKAFLTDNVLTIITDSYKFYWDRLIQYQMNATSAVKIRVAIKEEIAIAEYVKASTHFLVTPCRVIDDVLDTAWMNHKVIRPFEDIFSWFEDCVIFDEVKDERKNLRDIVEGQLLIKFPVTQYAYVLFHQGLGETVIFFHMMDIIKEKLGQKILILTFSKSRKDVLERSEYVDSIAYVTPLLFDYLAIYYCRDDGFYNLLKGYGLPRVNDYVNLNRASSSWFERWKYFWRVNKDYKLKPTTISLRGNDTQVAVEFIEAHNIEKDKAIFLVTDGIAIPFQKTNKIFYDVLVKRLNLEGYTILANKGEYELPNTIPVSLGVGESAALAGLTKIIMGPSTGFIEAICSLNQKDKIYCMTFWPNPYDHLWRFNTLGWWNHNMPVIKDYGTNFVQELARRQSEFCRSIWMDNIKQQNFFLSADAGENDTIIDSVVRCIQNMND